MRTLLCAVIDGGKTPGVILRLPFASTLRGSNIQVLELPPPLAGRLQGSRMSFTSSVDSPVAFVCLEVEKMS